MEIVSSGIVAVPSGVSSTGLYLIQEGILQVLDGGWAQDIGLAEGGQALVSNGGILYLCTVSSGGTATVLKSGYAQDVTVENGGLYLVSSGGTAHKSLIQSGGTQILYADVIAAEATVMNGGVLDASSGAFVRTPVISQGGVLHVWNGALADGALISGLVEVNSKATVNSAAVLDGGKLAVLTGGYAYEAKISSGCTLDISPGGSASSASVYDGGKIHVSSGGFAGNATVNPGGRLDVFSGATATKVKENGGYVQVSDGADVAFTLNTFSGVALNKASATVHVGTTATETIINASGILHISSGGTADDTTVNSRGSMFVSAGGTANSTTVNSRGSMFVFSGGLADGTVLSSGGILNVSAGGIARDTTVSLGGRFTVLSGGTASDVALNGRITVSSGGTATGLVVSDGALWDFAVAPGTLIAGTSGGSSFEISNGLVSGCTVNTGDTLNISSGGAADSVTVNGGALYVESTGILNNTTLNRGTIFVYEKAIATNITVSSGTLSVMDGGLADGIAVSSGGSFSLYRESLADNATVFSGGEIRAFNGGDLENAAVSGGLLAVASLGLANSATVNGGELQISSGGLANDVLVSSGDLHIFTGGMANSATVSSGGRVILESKGTVNHATVGAGGTLKIESGGELNSALIQGDGKLLGYFDCANITFASGAALYFDVSTIAPGNKGALVDLTRLSDPETVPFRLLISDSQETGVYKLAESAAGFDRTISVVNSVMELGSISTDEPVWINGKEYTLNLNDDELTLSVSAPTTQYVYLDFDGEELVRYSNPDLALSLDLSVAAPAFSEEQRAAIVSELAKQYNKYNIAFTLERPEGVEYSTLYFGQSAAFAEYGDFFGVAETHDGNNQNHTDNAFVLLDENYSQGQIVSVASHMLDHLLGLSCFGVDGTPSLRKYAENQTLLSGSSDWIQSDPYNKYCPIDPKNDKRCITGCTNNAASQIIYYWLEKGMLDLTLTLEDSDAYKCTTGVTIDCSDAPASGHLSFAETNRLLSAFDLENIDCIAALCFAAGVVQKAQYSSTSTGAFWNKNLFIRAGFDPASVVDKYMTVINWPESSESYDVDPNTRLADSDFMVGELLQGRPVGVSLQSIAHAVVVDGYDSARNMFHLNFGWGEDKNRWCTLEELIDLQIDEAVCGIAPVVSPDLTVKKLSAGASVVSSDEDVTLSFTVSNEGTEVSQETFAYIYCGDTLLGGCGLNYISPGYSCDFTCTVNTAPLQEGKNVLTVKVGSQNGEGGISSASSEITIDNTAPLIKLDADTETVVRQTTLTATVDDGSTIQYRIGEFGLWKEYKEPIIASLNETYYFMAMDDAGNIGTNQITFGNIDTSGILLSTLWSQKGINPMGGNTTILFNEYTPLDPSVTPEAHCLTGCVNTASGQLIYYFIEKGWLDLPLTLKKSDEYTSKHKATEEGGEKIVIEIKADGTTPGTLSFAEINAMLSDYQLDSSEHAAALLYAIGVVLESKYSASSTGTSWNRVFFKRAGFEGETMGGPYFGEYYWGDMDDEMQYTITDAGFEVLIENLEAGLPVGATYPGHAFVIDGYDRESDTFHINLGWGYNQATRWYTRDEMQEELNCEYFVYDLNPEYVETFTVTDARVYGTGTMIRAFERAAGMIGDNTVAFDPSVAGKTVELLNHITFFDEVISVKDFNMNVLVTESQGGENSYGFYADHLDVFEPTDPATVLTFHASGGSLIVSTEKEFNYAFQMEDGLSCTVDANGMMIYAGKTIEGTDAAAVLQALQTARSGNTEVSGDLLDSNGWSYNGSAGEDVFRLSSSSLAVGNVTLGDGDDVLTLADHSRLYGTIDVGDGDDSITVDSTSSISGDLSGKSKLSFVLAAQEDHALFTIKKSVSDLYVNTTLSVDMSDSEIGTYTLFTAASGATGIENLQNMVFTVTGSGGPDFTLSVNGTATSDYADLVLDGNSLKLHVKAEPRPVISEYGFLINGELLSVRKDFAAGDTFNTITLTTEQLNTFEWTNAEEGVSITVNGIALENGKCEFALAKIGETEKIHVQVTQDGDAREFLIKTLNTNLPPITVEGASQTPGDYFLSFFNTRSIIKTDKNGNIVYYRNEDSPETKYGLWDFKAHQLNGKTYYSYHSAYSDPDAFVTTGHNPGERVIMDEHYNEIARITAVSTEKNGGETALDGHEFLMLGEDHYIVLSYLQVEADNIPDVNQYTGEPIEHADKAVLVAAYIQEIDHGEVKFEWLSTDHPELYSMTVTEQVANANDFTNTDPDTYIDYVHLNAIVVDDDGNLVASCRHLDSMIKIDRNGGTGNLLWALSGLGDDFGLTDEQKTSGQHYLRYLGNGFFSVFNNNNKEGVTKLFLYHLNEDETALSGDDGFRDWVVPGTTQFEPGLPCPPHKTYACGAFQLIGEYGVAGWGWNLSGDELVTEFKLDDVSQITFQLRSVYDPSAEYASYRIVKCLSSAPELTFTAEKASWSEVEASSGYVLSIGQKDAGNALQIGVSDTACDIYNLPNGKYSAVVTEKDLGVSSAESSMKVENNLLPAAVASTANGIDDLFFAKAGTTWKSLYYACHTGSVNDWGGTMEKVSANRKNRIADLFFGSDDANILCLTDDENGDGIFVDDEYTELPDGIEGQQARIARIDEIRAGAGDDIVDMTSNRIEYTGNGLTVRGGAGDDTIWANKGENMLFGDAGNDRIVGASGNDVIAGGVGNDRMHGGGGVDVFTFCENFGTDTIEQLADGFVLLWFASGSEENWDESALTYTLDENNSVTVSGVTAEQISLKFGNDWSDMFNDLVSIGAFLDFSSEKIFEENGKGILA